MENESLEITPELKKELDEIDKETLKMPFVENENNSLSFEISHNRIIFLDKPIKRREKTHKNGKYSYGKDYRSNLEIEILDRDYGKSAELIRLVLETKKKSKALIILGIIFSFIIIIIVLVFVGNIVNKQATQQVENKPIITPIIPPNQGTPQETQIKNIDNVTNNDIIIDENKNKNDLTNNQMLALEYQAEEMSLQINLLMKKNEFLQSELNEKTLLITQKDELINKKSNEIEEISQKLKNLTSNDFILYLGNKIADECEKNSNNYCKDLYFNYIKKQ